MRRIGDHGAGDAACLRTQHGDAPGNRAAPIVADDGEPVHAQRIGQQEDVADQLVGRVGIHFLGTGRSAIAALVGCDAAEAVAELRDLVTPAAVVFGKAVQEDQHRRIARADIDCVQFDPVCEHDVGLLHHSACIFSM